MFGLIALRIALTYDDQGEVDESKSMYGIAVTLLQASVITLANTAYIKTANHLTNFENHRTESQHQRSRIFKVFLFQFINSYFYLYNAAFLKKLRIKVFGYGPEQCINNPYNDLEKDCLYDLSYQVVVLFGSIIVTNNVFEIGVSNVLTMLRKMLCCCCGGCGCCGTKKKNDDDLKQKSTLRRQYELDAYEGTFGDYAEIVIQFGYVSLFAVAMPAIPILALFNNWCIESWVDRKKLLFWRQRPPPQSAEDIGLWIRILDVLGFIAVLTNVGVCIFTSGAFDQETFETKFGYFILIEHCVLILQLGIKYGVTKWNENLIHTRRDKWVLKELGSLSSKKKGKVLLGSKSSKDSYDKLKMRKSSSSGDGVGDSSVRAEKKKKVVSSLSKRVRQPREL